MSGVIMGPSLGRLGRGWAVKRRQVSTDVDQRCRTKGQVTGMVNVPNRDVTDESVCTPDTAALTRT